MYAIPSRVNSSNPLPSAHLGIPVEHPRVNQLHLYKSAELTQRPCRSDFQALVLDRKIPRHIALLRVPEVGVEI